MPDTVEISVIVPTYDTREMTLSCCRAALDALAGRGELIVSDDGSSDGTAEAIAVELPGVIVVRSETNRGYSRAANAGAAVAKGALLLFLNSDAFLSDEAVRRLVALFETDTAVGIATPQLVQRDGNVAWTGGAEPSLLWLTVLAAGAARWRRRHHSIATGVTDVEWITGAAMAVRRPVWQAYGPFATRYRFYGQDLELCARARRGGVRIVIDRGATVVHLHGATIGGNGGLRHDPEMLWSDLLTWAGTVHGAFWTWTARLLMAVAGAMRVVVRSAVGSRRDGQFRLETRSYARAVRGLVREPFTRRR